MDRKFDSFDTWDEVLTHVESGARTYYQAPLDYRPIPITAKVRRHSKKVWIIAPPSSDYDAFYADAAHLDRFRKEA